MNSSSKYIAMDVHTATISVAVRDAAGKLIMESVMETKTSTILATQNVGEANSTGALLAW
ncbi:MAG: hypothetical protein DMG40_03995 [Acidobacteria bacterium]|nr:MAG: hypothetical protein DMG40_03995 [Acidobacteriota bacterium]